MRLFDLMEACLDHWQGTPEEFGAALSDATAEPLGPGPWYSREFRARHRELRQSARAKLLALPGGKELIDEQERQDRLDMARERRAAARLDNRTACGA